MNKELKTFLKKIPPVMWLVLLRRYWYEKQRERQYRYYKSLSPDQYPEALKKWYKKRTGKTLNLENPQTYNEKIQWLKLYDATPLKTRLADKYLVRDWVAEKIGEEYLIPLLGVYDKFDDIDFDALPDKFVIKATHDSGTYRIVTDKSEVDIAEARKFFYQRMRMNFAFRAGLELHYLNIIPRIILEEFMENNDDYKVWCFGGKAYFVEYITERSREPKRAIYDRDWNLTPFVHGTSLCDSPVDRPAYLEKLLSLAEALSAGFPHVRVDFYCLTDGSIKFGEMTFTPSTGTGDWHPEEYDKIIGDYIKLPEKSEMPTLKPFQ